MSTESSFTDIDVIRAFLDEQSKESIHECKIISSILQAAIENTDEYPEINFDGLFSVNDISPESSSSFNFTSSPEDISFIVDGVLSLMNRNIPIDSMETLTLSNCENDHPNIYNLLYPRSAQNGLDMASNFLSISNSDIFIDELKLENSQVISEVESLQAVKRKQRINSTSETLKVSMSVSTQTNTTSLTNTNNDQNLNTTESLDVSDHIDDDNIVNKVKRRFVTGREKFIQEVCKD